MSTMLMNDEISVCLLTTLVVQVEQSIHCVAADNNFFNEMTTDRGHSTLSSWYWLKIEGQGQRSSARSQKETVAKVAGAINLKWGLSSSCSGWLTLTSDRQHSSQSIVTQSSHTTINLLRVSTNPTKLISRRHFNKTRNSWDHTNPCLPDGLYLILAHNYGYSSWLLTHEGPQPRKAIPTQDGCSTWVVVQEQHLVHWV